jgi:hypothetical protein
MIILLILVMIVVLVIMVIVIMIVVMLMHPDDCQSLKPVVKTHNISLLVAY